MKARGMALSEPMVQRGPIIFPAANDVPFRNSAAYANDDGFAYLL